MLEHVSDGILKVRRHSWRTRNFFTGNIIERIHSNLLHCFLHRKRNRSWSGSLCRWRRRSHCLHLGRSDVDLGLRLLLHLRLGQPPWSTIWWRRRWFGLSQIDPRWIWSKPTQDMSANSQQNDNEHHYKSKGLAVGRKTNGGRPMNPKVQRYSLINCQSAECFQILLRPGTLFTGGSGGLDSSTTESVSNHEALLGSTDK